MTQRLAYACLQVTRQGQASYAHVHEIIDGLVDEGWDVTLYQPAFGETDNRGALSRLGAFLAVQIRLGFNLHRYDAVYCRAHFALWPVSVLCRMRHVPIVHEVNGPFEDLYIAWPWTRRFSRLFEGLTRSQYANADALITVTDGLAAWLGAEISCHVNVIPNGANTSIFSPEASSSLDLPERFVSFHGSFAAWQGVPTILDALRRPEWPAGVSLVFAGAGAMESEVTAAAIGDRRVVDLGVVPYDLVAGVLAKALAGLAMMSNLQGRAGTGLSPLKLYEILACGTPVIASDFPGQADVVVGADCGIVIPAEDPTALAMAVAAVSRDPAWARAMGARGREEVVAHHSWSARAKDTSEVLRQVIGGGDAIT